MFPNGAPLLKKNEKVSETDWDGTKINSYLNCGDINGKFYCDVGVGSNVVYSQSAPNAYSAYLHLQGNLTNDSYANGFIEILSKGSEKGYRVESFKDDTGTKFWLKSGVVGGKGPDSIECLMTEDSRKSYCKLFIWSDVYDVFTATSL